MSTDTAVLLAQISTAPDDDAPYLVLADALLQRGLLRGELIAVQHAQAAATGAQLAELWRRDVMLVEQHPGWLAPMADHARDLVVRWRNGFIHALRVRIRDVATWRAVIATPVVRDTLAEVRADAVWEWAEDREVDDDAPPVPERTQQLVDAIVATPPHALRRLAIGDLFWHGLTGAPVDLTGTAALPLDELTCAGDRLTLGWNAAPRLRALELRSARFDVAQLARVGRWPQLRALVLWVRDPRDLERVVTRARFPALRTLGLVGTEHTAAIADRLGRMPIVDQLDAIDLTGGTLVEAAPVAALARRVAVSVRLNLLPRAEARRLQHAGVQRTGELSLTMLNAISHLQFRAQRRASVVAAAIARADDDARRAALYAGEVASCHDDHRMLLSRIVLARRLGRADAGPALADIGAALDRRLSPHLTSALCVEVAHRLDDAGAADAAAPWRWRAHRLAQWHGAER